MAATEAVRALLLGHRGMLGHVVGRYLSEQGHRVVTTLARFSTEELPRFESALAGLEFDAIINCAARKTGTEAELFDVNAELPRWLVQRYPSAVLVQPSTDGVFSGRQGPYLVDQPTDAEDPYGLSKRRAEQALVGTRAVVLRCSIIGPELGPGTSLMSWLSQQTGEVTGYSDRLWNGITTLGWARLSASAVTGALGAGVHQPACSPAVTKAELLRIIAETYRLPVSVRSLASGAPSDRRLVPTLDLGPIAQQLVELAAWYPRGSRAP